MKITSKQLIKVNTTNLFRVMWQPIWVRLVSPTDVKNTSPGQSMAKQVENSDWMLVEGRRSTGRGFASLGKHCGNV